MTEKRTCSWWSPVLACLSICCWWLLLLHSANAFSLISYSRRTTKSPLVQPIFLDDYLGKPLHVASTSSSATAINRIPINGAEFHPSQDEGALNAVQRRIVKIAMILYVASLCVALPVTLFPNWAAYKLRLQDRIQKEKRALRIGQWCTRTFLKLIPFCKIRTIPNVERDPPEAIWVCNHTSMLDIFLLMASDKKLRGKSKRPIKIVYWKQLEDNPVTKLLFQQCGFIPVNMAANKPGEDNDYDRASFKDLLKRSKQAFQEGFDVGILPEGQLNPTPELGLLPVFPGAYTLAKMARRPIHMMALHGVHRLWHPHEDVGMTPSHNVVHIRAYPLGRKYDSADEFMETFRTVVGHFGQYGEDLPNVEEWLDGTAYQRQTAAQQGELEGRSEL